MSSTQPIPPEMVPAEFKSITKKLVATLQKDGNGKNDQALVLDFAKVMGIAMDMVDLASTETMHRLTAEKTVLGHFRNNVELLVQKTWVEKADESLKEKLLDRVPVFIQQMENSKHSDAVKTFSSIADELAYLLFGTQSRKSDFIEYAFRIDGQIGLFWWYTATLDSLNGSVSPQLLRLMIFIGICYLASL